MAEMACQKKSDNRLGNVGSPDVRRLVVFWVSS